MNVTKISYSKVFALPNFQNEKIGAEIELNEGENPQLALDEARKFVEFSSSRFQNELDDARRIISNPEDYTGRQLINAKAIVQRFEESKITNKILEQETQK